MMTRQEKREKEKEFDYFFEFLKIKKHFFKDFIDRLQQVKDHRCQSHISYRVEVLLFTLLLKNIFGLKSMRDMTERLNKDECIENVRRILKLDLLPELPHYDTINNFLCGLDMEELEKLRTYMVRKLVEKRCFEAYRIEDRYWGIIIDGTGLYTFNERHCDHCLKREFRDKETGETKSIYMHHVLEAKLVVGEMVFSVASEFIENESENVPKQDCELKAFHRLAKKLKKTFKRLPICVIGDSLYACENVFELCEKNRWKYIFRFKEGRIKSVATEFEQLKKMKQPVAKEKKTFWINGISYNQRTVNVMETTIGKRDGKSHRYVYITDFPITKKNVEHLLHAGRSRWKIENEGFNEQKNLRYEIEHANSHHYNAMKNHYLMTQIADILMQLYENGVKILKEFKKTIKQKSSDLLETFRKRTLTDEDFQHLGKTIQVRFT
ncbi:transposase family protein [Fictibacillus sp. Mic-4]|uniref:transposase family protein n=1 Tax=Fictibacillus sp. Mic-4 TaxID=3132826 RepID=UPI00176FEB59|nr:transposase [Escherichia coli]